MAICIHWQMDSKMWPRSAVAVGAVMVSGFLSCPEIAKVPAEVRVVWISLISLALAIWLPSKIKPPLKYVLNSIAFIFSLIGHAMIWFVVFVSTFKWGP